jgi:hypothetical protein
MFPTEFSSADMLICHKKPNLSTLDRKEKECYLKPVDFWVVCLNVHMFTCSGVQAVHLGLRLIVNSWIK